jgi:hypothetical protein
MFVRGFAWLRSSARRLAVAFYDIPIPDPRKLLTKDEKGRVCSGCGSRMIVAETINTTTGSGRG